MRHMLNVEPRHIITVQEWEREQSDISWLRLPPTLEIQEALESPVVSYLVTDFTGIPMKWSLWSTPAGNLVYLAQVCKSEEPSGFRCYDILGANVTPLFDKED